MQRWMLVMGLLTTVGTPATALACGCFTPPDPSVPILQAGERLVFAADNGTITAHIQIQYQGDAQQFGWLLPLPSVPDLALGTEDLFTAIANATQPRYRVFQNIVRCNGSSSSGFQQGVGCGASYASNTQNGPPVPDDTTMGGDPKTVVVEDVIGPYEFAVLHADDKQEMLDWLAANRFFVPTGLDTAVDPYIHPGAYFLALKLRSGKSAGDVQPVVVRYASDLPMIPIVLTQVGAVPDMGVQVWLLGSARAIPRNYHQTVLNDMALYLGTPYEKLVTQAVKEAPKRHSFVTEYAGPSSVAKGSVVTPGRYGNPVTLRGLTDAVQYCAYLKGHGFTFNSTLVAILGRYLTLPEDFGYLDPAVYYQDLGKYVDQWKTEHAMQDGSTATIDLDFDPMALTDEIEMRIVQPARDAEVLIAKYPYLTRLFTTLSPADMTDDPVFSFNPDLPEVGIEHVATYNQYCGYQATLTAPSGLDTYWRGFGAVIPDMPSSLHTEIVRESGTPVVITDNTTKIQTALAPNGVDHPTAQEVQTAANQNSGGGCQTSGPARSNLIVLGVLMLSLLGLRIARRRHDRRVP